MKLVALLCFWLAGLVEVCCFAAEPQPMPPLPKSPVQEFRALLQSSDAELAAALRGKNPEQRRYIEQKITEYRLLPPAERDRRLQNLELRWHLRPLLELAPAERKVELVPEPYRVVILERLQHWDLLPEPVRKEILENEWAMNYFMPGTRRPLAPEEVGASKQKQLEQKLARWKAISPDRREKMSAHFNEFFNLPEKEQRKTLHTLSQAEREEMEGALKLFSNLAPEQRKLCLESFQKFAGLSAQEQLEFLKNAERWKAMTPAERQTWRQLVSAVPPLPMVTAQPPIPGGAPSSQLTPSK